jgi:hypothetical protein
MFFHPMDKCLSQDNSEAGVLALSKMIGDTLDFVESEKYGLFRTIEGFQSAVLFKFPDNTYAFKVNYVDEMSGLDSTKWIPQDASELVRIINRVIEIEGRPEDVLSINLLGDEEIHAHMTERKDYNWMVEAAGLVAEIHDDGYIFHGFLLKYHYHGILTRYLGIEAGYIRFSGWKENFGSDEIFISLNVGIRLRLNPKGKISPFIGAGKATGGCNGWSGIMSYGCLGLEARIHRNLRITGTFQMGSHGGAQGPTLFALGIGLP